MNTTQTSPPLYIRLPRPGGRCVLTGLSRSTLAELTVPGPRNQGRPPVASKYLRSRNATRGIRLILVTSLLDYIARLPAS